MLSFRSLLFVWTWVLTTKAQTNVPTLAPSDMPSEVPSDIPSDIPSFVPSVGSAMPSSVPTIEYDVCFICGEGNVVSEPTGRVLQYSCAQAELAGLAGNIKPDNCRLFQSDAAAPENCGCVPASEFECTVSTCTFYPSMADLKNAAAVRSNICMCSTIFRPQGTGGCTGTVEDTITIEADRDVTIECVDNNLECRLQCPNTVFEVKGSLTLIGNGRMSLRDGETESRVYVASGGTLTMSGMSIVRTSSFIAVEEGIVDRRLQKSSGKGAGVYNDGNLSATGCIFSNNTAELQGGSIFSSGNVEIVNSEFRNNKALIGGGVYVQSGSISVRESIFEDNTVTGDNVYGDIFVSEEATLEGCGNIGLEGSLTAACPESTAVAWTMPSLSMGLMLLVWVAL